MTTQLNPKQFFLAALNNRLTIEDFEFKNDETTSKKLDVLIEAMSIHKMAQKVGYFGHDGIHIKADIGAGNRDYYITFKLLKSTDIVPVSIFKGELDAVTRPNLPIVCILTKNKNDKFFNTLTYRSKNINIENLHITKSIADIIDYNILSELKPKSMHKQKNISEKDKTANIDTSTFFNNLSNIYQPPEITSLDGFEFISAEEIAAASERDISVTDKKQIKSIKNITHLFGEKKNKDNNSEVDKSTQTQSDTMRQEQTQKENKRSSYSSFPTVNRPSGNKDAQSKEHKKDNPSL